MHSLIFFFSFKRSASPRVTLKLKKPKNDKKVKWTTETVDNENMNKKKSKCKIIRKTHLCNIQGPVVQNLTTSLVNVSLKFQTLILQIHCYFLLKKCENPLRCKGFSHFFNKK